MTGRGSVVGRALAGAGGALLFPALAILISFAIGAVLILATGNNPIAAYFALLTGAFGSPAAIGRTLVNTTPLIFTGLAVAVAFRAGLFNIGGEGQFYIGAVTAAWLGVSLGALGPLALPIVLLACIVAGFLWGAIPGALKAYFGAHEVITTIMLNFIAINLTVYLALNPLRGSGLVPGTENVAAAARIPVLGFGLGRANFGILLALLAAVVAYLLLWRTKRGFQIRAVGLSPGAANYAGIPIGRNTVLAIAIGAAFAGLGGGVEVMGVYGKMAVPFVTNVGFNGIGVALLGRNHPFGVVLGALVFGGLFSGAQEMQFQTDVPLSLTVVLLAVILLIVTATKLVELILGKRARTLASGTRLERAWDSKVEEFLSAFGTILASTLRNATPLIFAALGGLFSERSGVVNIGLEGLMLISAFAGAVGSFYSGSALVGLATALAAGLLFALIHAIMCVTFEADQIISGTAINLLALGGTGFLMVVFFGSGGTTPRVSSFEPLRIPGLADIPAVGPALFEQSLLVYLMYVLVPLTYFVVFRTPFGLRLRASGEVPEAVDTAGVSVTRMRYFGVALSGLLAALGGVYLSMSLLSAFTENMTTGRGFIALAALIFGRWNPIGAAAAALLFGLAQAVTFRVAQDAIPIEFVQMFPYILTIVVLAGFGGRAIAPSALGKPYRKE